MKTAESVLAVCVVGLACFIGGQTVASQHAPVHSEAAGAIETGRVGRIGTRTHDQGDRAQQQSIGPGSAEVETVVASPYASTERSLEPRELRARLSEGAAGTYIDDLLNARDSALTRWPDRLSRPLRVWISDSQSLQGWNADFMPAVRDAFDTWVQAGVPVHFTFVIDSSSADVHVGFIERFGNGISGKTVWSRDAAWWLVSSDITLGLAHPTGGVVSAPQMRAIALHEVGHLLGLDHSHDLDNIMSARIRVRDITETDRATMRLLYSVPAGSLK